MQHCLSGRVAERHVVEDDVAGDRGQVDGVGPLGHARLGREEVLQLVDRGLTRLVGGVELHELLDRGEEGREVEHERGELPIVSVPFSTMLPPTSKMTAWPAAPMRSVAGP